MRDARKYVPCARSACDDRPSLGPAASDWPVAADLTRLSLYLYAFPSRISGESGRECSVNALSSLTSVARATGCLCCPVPGTPASVGPGVRAPAHDGGGFGVRGADFARERDDLDAAEPMVRLR